MRVCCKNIILQTFWQIDNNNNTGGPHMDPHDGAVSRIRRQIFFAKNPQKKVRLSCLFCAWQV